MTTIYLLCYWAFSSIKFNHTHISFSFILDRGSRELHSPLAAHCQTKRLCIWQWLLCRVCVCVHLPPKMLHKHFNSYIWNFILQIKMVAPHNNTNKPFCWLSLYFRLFFFLWRSLLGKHPESILRIYIVGNHACMPDANQTFVPEIYWNVSDVRASFYYASGYHYSACNQRLTCNNTPDCTENPSVDGHR